MKKRYTIGVMIGNANSPHTMDLMQGIFHAAQSMDVNVILFLGIHSSYYYKSYFGEDVEDDYDYQFNAAYDYQAFADLDVLVIAYGSLCIFLDEKESATFLEKYRDKPRVLLEERDKTGTSTSIITDNYNGMYAIAEHLVKDHGYRNFTYLAGPHGNTDARERRQAVYDVMEKYEIPFGPERIAYGDYSSCVQKQVNHLLDAYPDMEAMICANDVMAETAYRVVSFPEKCNMVFWQRKLILPIWLYFILSAGRLEICCVCIRCRKSKKGCSRNSKLWSEKSGKRMKSLTFCRNLMH